MTLDAGADFESLLEYLRDTRGFDFTGYKRASLVRRVSQRCTELGIGDFRTYVDYLQVHADEFAILFDKILINVTQFFRNEHAWNFVAAHVVPPVVSREGEIRIWSAGTSSGEEAYSAAILFCEKLGEEAFLKRVKIYATDVDEHALEKARSGYSPSELSGLSEDMRSRYFEVHGETSVFRTALRRTVIFGRHDLTQDAPISRLDLLICRNTLIYFTAEAQDRILARFHYALNDDGFLFLGRSEMLPAHTALFTQVDAKERVFTKVARPQPRDRPALLAPVAGPDAADTVAREVRLRELAIEGIPYPVLVIDPLGNLASANEAARSFFGIPSGDIGRSLKDLELSYRPLDLRTPLDRVARERRMTLIPGLELKARDGSRRLFDIHFAPLRAADGSVAGTSVNFLDVTQQMDMRRHLDRMTEELHSSTEELETTNEELQSTVEELETTNEELQSSNEELETLNEELESTNAELQSINSDLVTRTRDVERLNTLLLAITGNIEVGAAVLDRGGKVQVWNARAVDLWGVRSDEVLGRSFFDLDIGLPAPELRAMVERVTGGHELHEEVVVNALTRRGRQIRCRVMAHTLGIGDQPTGVVLVMEELKAERPARA